MKTIGIVAISLDGFITKHDEEGTAFTSAADQKFFMDALKEFDCCIFGSKTFFAGKAPILRNLSKERLRIVLTRSPEKYAAYQQPDMLEFSRNSPKEIITELTQRGKKCCAVLGGSEVYGLFLGSHFLDELWLTVEPKLFGEGKKLVSEKIDIPLRLKECFKLAENTLLLKYILM